MQSLSMISLLMSDYDEAIDYLNSVIPALAEPRSRLRDRRATLGAGT